jgi:hypothetical protein
MGQKKRRTRKHVLADLSVNHVERFIFQCGFSCERVEHDYGTDLLMFTFDANGEIENGHVQIQIKATDHPKYHNDAKSIACPVEMAHLWSWSGEPCPVILVRYDAVADKGYWLYVQRELERSGQCASALADEDVPTNGDEPQEKATLLIPLGNRLDCEAIMQFRDYRDHILDQVKGIIRHDQ